MDTHAHVETGPNPCPTSSRTNSHFIKYLY